MKPATNGPRRLLVDLLGRAALPDLAALHDGDAVRHGERLLPESFARPAGPIAFAGEHLGGEFAALMEGAIRSGRKAARALLGSPSGARA
jgi:monoamine oxidase